MPLFNPTDVANAADDPFGFAVGRHEIVISFSGEDTITNKDKSETWNVWKVTCSDPDNEYRKRDVLFFTDGTEEQQDRTNTAIKKMLVALEVPESRWGEISVKPEKLEGTLALIEIVQSKKNDKTYLNWIGPVRKAVPGSTGLDVFKSPVTAGAGPDPKLGF